MDDLINRRKVLNEIFEWVMKCENEKPDAMKLLGERIRNIQSEKLKSVFNLNFILNDMDYT